MNLFKPNPSETTKQLYFNNLEFFRVKHPTIYTRLAQRALQTHTIEFDIPNKTFDIHDGEKFIYEGNADQYCKDEVKQFKKTYSPGKPLNNINPPMPGNYFLPRFFHSSINAVIEKSGVTPHNFLGYKVPDFYPLMCFLGCSSGLHIEEFIMNNKVLSCVIIEPDIECFCLSLYLIDWKTICEKFDTDKGRSIQFVIGENLSPDNFYSIVWNTMVNYAPQFPIGTFFYVHQGKEKYWEIVSRLNKDIRVFLGLWGFYDDEINQFNNSFNNIAHGYESMAPKPDRYFDIPACVVGSGPSLDKRIEDLKAIKEKSIVISCGTALGALYKHGIKPDIHVELESHYCAYEDCVKKIEDIDPEWLSDIDIIGAVQLTPKMFFPFRRKIMFYKESLGIVELFCPPNRRLLDTTPTCTNTGLSVAGHLNFSNILFFGMDFGFASSKEHHSKHAIYYDDDTSDAIKKNVEYNDNELITVKSVNGGKIPTTDGYYTAMRRIENLLILLNNGHRKIYNCSEGADIKGAPHLASEQLLNGFKNAIVNKTEILNIVMSKLTPAVTHEDLNKQINRLNVIVRELFSKLQIILEKNTPTDLLSAYEFSFKTTLFLQTTAYDSLGALYFTFRGSIWHYLLSLVSLTMALDNIPDKDSKKFVKEWVIGYRDLLKELPKHFYNSTNKTYPDMSDPWLNCGLESSESPI